MAATPNPLAADNHSTPGISSKTYHIAGILTTVYGLEELSKSCKSVSCLWLLHPRLQTRQTMESAASTCINEWNQKGRSSDHSVGLIAVAFDQRNHGSREVNKLANQAWRDGNPTHAQDMFSIFHGTAMDTSLLIDHLGSYVFVDEDRVIEQNLVLGVSLGGHAAWQLFFADPRITAGIVIIGCPDYMRVMSDRAKLTKLETYTKSNGADFLGSKDFPGALVASIKKWDPRGLLFGNTEIQANPSESEQRRLREVLDAKIKGKKLLVCSGGDDKLVPYHCSQPFMDFLKNATGGWYQDGNVYVEDNVYPGVGHVYSEGMIKDTTRFVNDILTESSPRPASKM